MNECNRNLKEGVKIWITFCPMAAAQTWAATMYTGSSFIIFNFGGQLKLIIKIIHLTVQPTTCPEH